MCCGGGRGRRGGRGGGSSHVGAGLGRRATARARMLLIPRLAKSDEHAMAQLGILPRLQRPQTPQFGSPVCSLQQHHILLPFAQRRLARLLIVDSASKLPQLLRDTALDLQSQLSNLVRKERLVDHELKQRKNLLERWTVLAFRLKAALHQLDKAVVLVRVLRQWQVQIALWEKQSE